MSHPKATAEFQMVAGHRAVELRLGVLKVALSACDLCLKSPRPRSARYAEKALILDRALRVNEARPWLDQSRL